MTLSALYTDYTITSDAVIEASYSVNGTVKAFHKYSRSEFCLDYDYGLSEGSLLVCKADAGCEEEVRSSVGGD